MKTALRLAVATFTAATVLAAPALTSAQAPTRDFVTASGAAGISPRTLVFNNIDINVTSGPSGENPTGHVSFFREVTFESASITCLSVSGNTAVIAGSLQPNSFGVPGFLVRLVDNGPANSQLDTFAADVFFPTVPTVCLPPLPSGLPLIIG